MSSIRRSFSIGAALSAIEYAHRAGLRAETRALDELTAEKAKAEIMTINVGTIGHTRLPDVTTMTETDIDTLGQRDGTSQAPDRAPHSHLSRQQLRAAARADKKAEDQRARWVDRIKKGAKP